MKLENPSAVQTLRYDTDNARLAVARADGPEQRGIEIWSYYNRRCWDQVAFIPPDEDRPVDVLEWTKYGLLLSAGANGFITSYCPKSCKVLANMDSGASAVWCMRKSPDGEHLAVGGEDGIVRIYEIMDTKTEMCLLYLKSFERQEKRVLSLSWHSKGKLLCTSGVGSIRIWNVETGRMHRQLAVSKEGNMETTVWCNLFLTDYTIVTGDSNGRINFYNGKLGALVQSIKKHKRDILTIAASKNERMVFASGVDPLVLAYENIRVGESDFEGKEEEWRRVWGHVLHGNDVRQLEIVDREIVSAGIDRNIVVARQKKAINDNSKSSSILHSYRQSPVCSVSKEARLFLLQGSCQLDLWKMADAAELDDDCMDEDEVSSEAPVHIFSLKTEPLRVSTISPDGNWVAFSTASKLRVYRVFNEDDNVGLEKIMIGEAIKEAPLQLQFSPDSKLLFYGTYSSELKSLKIDDDSEALVAGPTLQAKEKTQETLRAIKFSRTCKYVASIGLSSYLFNLEEDSMILIPRAATAYTAANFIMSENGEETLLASTASRDIHEFNLEGEYTKWSNSSSIPPYMAQFGTRPIILCDNESFTFMDRSRQESKNLTKIRSAAQEKKFIEENKGRLSHEGKNMKNFSRALPPTVSETEFTEICRWKYVLHAEAVSKDELLVIDRPVGEILASLPPAFHQKKFGNK
ncbi:Oidioi.mRNA.OKI2018_I69.chr2.g7567.t1.cds [Oikopleura dioica]|uniref:Oidioi.mRNA.OKI2018_I69.chr2.g7567.t1.cds n=1 Tax=Oikopleura dioica TaxID=34765 RepID=A0ABN7T775_OIKDI|nr:Oidioi.mRNA.OKI2018_I69.chr2.g7567.t1.cds [Oikopleura dioica]